MRMRKATRLACQGDCPSSSNELSADTFLAGIFLIGFGNGIADRLIRYAASGDVPGMLSAILSVSVIVWGGLAIGLSLILRDRPRPLTLLDYSVGGAGIVTSFVLPAEVSWIVITLLGLYGLNRTRTGSWSSRGFLVLVATTVPMFWSRALFQLFGDYILQIDAGLVALIVGTKWSANTVSFADGSGVFWIAPGCSSLANVSVAWLCWMTFTQYHGKKLFETLPWCIIACAAVIFINVLRISLIGYNKDLYSILHDGIGATGASWLTLFAIVGICFVGAQRQSGSHA